MAKYCPIYKEKVVSVDCVECGECKQKKIAWIALDQSYTDTGIAVAIGKKVVYVSHEDFKSLGKDAKKHDKRSQVCKRLNKLINKLKNKYDVRIVIEAVRLFSGSNPHISTAYIFGTCALIGSIVDVCAQNNVPIFWVETRSWKKGVLGKAKPSGKKLAGVKDIKKVDSVLYAISCGFKDEISYRVKAGKNKGQIRYNDNMTDAICIAVCGVLQYNLKKIDDF